MAKVIAERLGKQPELLSTLRRWAAEQGQESGDWQRVLAQDWPVVCRQLSQMKSGGALPSSSSLEQLLKDLEDSPKEAEEPPESDS